MNKSSVLALALSVSILAMPNFSSQAASQTPKPPTAMDDYRQAVQLQQQGDFQAAEQAIRNSLTKAPGDTLNTIKLAQLLTEQGRYNEAESLYKQVISLDANDGMIYFHLGALYEQTGKFKEASSAYQTGLQRNPQYKYGLYNLARVNIQLQQYNEAIDNYRRFLTDYPNHYEARNRLANLYLVAGQPDASAHEYDQIRRQFPQHFNQHLSLAKALTRSQHPEQALEELKLAVVQDGNKADVLQEMGLAHMAIGQTDYALQNFKKAFTADPKRTELLLQMADMEFENKKLHDAEEHYVEYLNHRPEDNNVRYTLASLHIKQKNYDAAITQFTHILQTNVNDVQRYNLEKEIAYAYQMKGELAQAIPRYEQLMKTERANDDIQLKTNLALAYHGHGDLEDAVNMYKSAYYQWHVHGTPQQQQKSVVTRAALAADLSNALSGLGDSAYKAGNYSEALEYYGEAGLYTNGKQVNHLLGLGNSYMALGIPSKAEEAYKAALGIEPTNQLAQLYVAKINVEHHNKADALPILKELATKNPNNLEFQLALGDAHAQLGQKEEALTIYQKALNSPTLTDPQQREAILLSMGAMQQSQNNLPAALDSYQMALAINDRNPKTHYNLGIIFNELGRLDHSLAAYQKALTLDNAVVEAKYGMGVTYEKQKKFADAINIYQSYVDGQKGQYILQAKDRITLLKNAVSPSEARNNTAAQTNTPVNTPVNTPQHEEVINQAETATQKITPQPTNTQNSNASMPPIQQQSQQQTQQGGYANETASPEGNNKPVRLFSAPEQSTQSSSVQIKNSYNDAPNNTTTDVPNKAPVTIKPAITDDKNNFMQSLMNQPSPVVQAPVIQTEKRINLE